MAVDDPINKTGKEESTRRANRRFIAILTALALLGVVSVALIPVEELAPQPFPIAAIWLRLLSLVNPALLALAAVFVGNFAARRVGLDAPAILALAEGHSASFVLARQIPVAVLAGVVVALLLLAYTPLLPSVLAPDFLARLDAVEMPLATRLLYGGITEEIIARWGLMSLIAWAASRIFEPNRPTCWPIAVAILISALLFAAAHLRIAATVGTLSFEICGGYACGKHACGHRVRLAVLEARFGSGDDGSCQRASLRMVGSGAVCVGRRPPAQKAAAPPSARLGLK